MTTMTNGRELDRAARRILAEQGVTQPTFDELAAAQREARGPIEREHAYRAHPEAVAEVAEQVLRERGVSLETVDGAAYAEALREAESRLGGTYVTREETP